MNTHTSLPLFYKSLVVFDTQIHKNFHLQTDNLQYGFAQDTDVIPITAKECFLAQASYPIFFVQDQTKALPILAALVGLGARRNLFITEQGQWIENAYIPAWVRSYPFTAIRGAGPEFELLLGFDASSDLISANDHGQRLIESNGAVTELLGKIMGMQKAYQQSLDDTRQQLQVLLDHDLLQSVTLTFSSKAIENKDQVINGLLAVDQQKFNALSGDILEKLHAKGVLELVYAHLFSMRHLDTLARLAGSA